MIKLKSHDNKEITGSQIRAARALVRWSAKDLAREAGLGVATISRAEVEEGRTTLTSANLKAIQVALENAGIEFILGNGGGVGVRFRDSK